MEYNTQLSKLRLPEYGRNIQRMVDHAKAIEDREERTRAANTIIQVMGSLNPSLRETRDFRHKLWDHLHLIADFTLDVDSSYPTPSKEQFQSKPARIPYPQTKIKVQHYGKILERLMMMAIEVEEGEKKAEFVKQIANHMKLCYLTWNKDSVTDTLILHSLREMSGGLLSLPDDTILAEIKELPAKSTAVKKKKGKGYKSKS